MQEKIFPGISIEQELEQAGRVSNEDGVGLVRRKYWVGAGLAQG